MMATSDEMGSLEMLFSRPLIEWEICQYRARHNPSGMCFWIANGRFSLETYESRMDVPLSWLQRRKVWRWYERVRQGKLAQMAYAPLADGGTGE
jgi:hypothetical protein